MEQALELRARARKKTTGMSSLFGKLGGKEKRIQESAEAEELYTEAANLFLSVRKFADAADSFEGAAHYAQSVYTSAGLNVEAAKAWKLANEPNLAIKAYAEAIAKFAHKGPLRRAAVVATELAQLYASEQRWEPALGAWKRAVDWFDEQHEAAQAAKARLGYADVAAKLGKYSEAIASYERAAEDASQDTLSRFMLKQYFVKAGLCHLANNDALGLRNALETKYTKWDRAFSATLEYRLLSELCASLQEMDVSRFEQALYVYDRKHRLDKWQLDISLRIKERFTNRPEDELL